MLGSAVLEFKVDYTKNKNLAIGETVHSDVVSVGGHIWRVECYPRGVRDKNKGEYLSIFLRHLSKSRSVKAIFEAFLIDRDGNPSTTATKRSLHLFPINGDGNNDWGWNLFVKRSDLEGNYVTEGHITFVCAIMVVVDNPIPVPPSDIAIHLGHLLDRTDGTDAAFTIGGETFHAHRAVLAARSPVFRSELLGSMAEATMPSITLHDIAPATFRVMLRFMYTDALPRDNELGDSPVEMFQHLLPAADRYALDRLKLMCAQKLWENVSVDTVADVLACAEMYNCPELKNRCIGFIVEEKNFKKVLLTDGFMQLGPKFPSIIAELREKVGT